MKPFTRKREQTRAEPGALMITHAYFYLAENLDNYLDCLWIGVFMLSAGLGLLSTVWQPFL